MFGHLKAVVTLSIQSLVQRSGPPSRLEQAVSSNLRADVADLRNT
jgi:hypothetical protein